MDYQGRESKERQNEAMFRRWFDEVWNQKRRDRIAELMDEGVVAHGMGPNGTVLSGPEPFAAAFDLFTGVFPDISLTVDKVVASGDTVAAHITCTGTHRGDGLGIPATGQQVSFPCMSMATYRDGLIVEGWNVIDLMSVLRQVQAVQLSSSLP
ncbi:MAG TPA: ester cyclase [Armatimonadaceae bacterium]|nr:ester cyclase [Armatimonadaceae bacterium]